MLNPVKSFDTIRKELKSAHRAFTQKDAKGGWRAVGKQFGISGAMAHLIATKGYEPRDPKIRTKLNLPDYALAPRCSECGDVHTMKRCPHTRKKNLTPPKPRTNWKKIFSSLRENDLNRLKKLEKILTAHRKKVLITCEHDCWCWELEATMSEAAKELLEAMKDKK